MAKRGEAGQAVVETAQGGKRDKRGTPYYDVVDEAGKLLCRVGMYHDSDVSTPEGMPRFLDFLPAFKKDVEAGKFAGLALDSVSSTTLSARKYHQYDLNPDTNNPLQWYGGAADIIEEVICLQLPSLPCHVGVAFHVHREKIESEGKMARQPFVPGKRMAESKSVAACYPELWRLYAIREEGKKIRRLQTDSDERYIAGTCIGVPDEMKVFKDPKRTWQEIEQASGGKHGPIHLALYADPHVGKSTLLSGMSRFGPLYVALFDGVGKDQAYRNLGKVKE